MADWKTFKFEIPGKDLLEPVREVLQTLLIFLEILKTILETIKAFLIDFGNPIRALVEALIKLIEELFEALKTTGLFAYFDVPDTFDDPSFARHRGGFEGFKTRFKASLFDTKDFNRPQPRPGSSIGGFVLLAVVATDIQEIIERIEALIRFFGKAWSMPRLGAANNFKVAAIGTGGDPILDVAKVFTDGPIEAIQLSWSLGTSAESANPGFGDAVTKMASEFTPNAWLIEKAEGDNPLAQQIDIGEMSSPQKVGIVTIERPTDFAAGAGGKFVGNEKQVRKEVLRDVFGEPFVKFHSYKAIDATAGTLEQRSSAIGYLSLGAIGKYRFIDTEVEPGKDYYYRVTAYSGTLDTDSNYQLTNPATTVKKLNQGQDVKQNAPHWDWPGKNVVMGVPSQVVRAAVPVDLGGFDVFESLRNLFLTAFSLDFHQPQTDDAEFDSKGYPEPGTPISGIGRSTLEGLGDGLREIASFVVVDVLGEYDSIYEAWDPDTNPTLIEGTNPKMPWEDGQVRFDAARLANIVSSVMLQLGDVVYAYRSMMTGPLPKGAVAGGAGSNLVGKTTLDEVCATFTERQLTETEPKRYYVDLDGATTFYFGYQEDPELRLNVQAAILYIKSFTLGGVPPDWISISPLRDIIPWSADIIYKLLDAIDALLAAFAGVIDEIKAFIDLLIRKIEALEALIQVLIDILNFIESLAFSAYMLIVPSVSGDVTAWIEEIDNAGIEDLPERMSIRDYSAGIGLAYVAADIAAFEAAFTIIFGAS